jgi:hypothetical protein
MCNGGYSQHRFSVKDINACSSKLEFMSWDRENMGSCLYVGFVKCRDLLVPFVYVLLKV